MQKALGPAWEQPGEPPEGWFTKGTAEAWLGEVLDRARRGTLPGMVRTGATFADAAGEWLRYVERERGCKASMLADYRSVVRVYLLPAFGELSLEQIDSEAIERWLAGQLREGELSRRSLQKFVVLLNGIFKRAQEVWKLPQNPAAGVERLSVPQRTEIDFYELEEVYALVRAAHDGQDGALFLAAAMTGLHMGELLALRWRDVDLPAQTVRVMASYTAGRLGVPRSGLGRAVPLVEEAAEALARLGDRERWTGPDDLVFVGTAGEYLDGSALRWRFKRARDAAGGGRCAFRIYAIPSAASPFVLLILGSSRSGWVTPTSPPRRSTCAARRRPTRHGGYLRRLARWMGARGTTETATLGAWAGSMRWTSGSWSCQAMTLSWWPSFAATA